MPKNNKKRSGFGLFVALVVGGVVGYKIHEAIGVAPNGNGGGEFDEEEQARQIEDRMRRVEDDHRRMLWRDYR